MNKSIGKNMITNLAAVFVTMLTNFIVTPVITEKLGFEAYSYVGIITNLISFFTVITYTLNSMVGRFYTIHYQRDERDEANGYISSALITCLLLGALLLPVMILATIFLDKIIIINPNFVTDVKIAFFCSCISFIFSTINSVFATGAYAKNKLYVTNSYTIIVGIIKTTLLYIAFKLLQPHIWFISISAALQTFIVMCLALYCFKKLIPEVKFSVKLFSKHKAKELLKAGSFNSVILMGNTLMTHIDLLIGNRFIDGAIVGTYSVILMFSSIMRNIGTSVSNAFSPMTLKIYTNKGVEGLRSYSNRVVSILGLLLGWPSVIIACIGSSFVSIWLHRDVSEYYYIFVILMLPMGANMACTQLYVVQQALNKLKIPALASIVAGVFNLVFALFLVRVCNLGIYGIAIASTVSFSLRNIVFQPLYTSIITNQNPLAFFAGLVKPVAVSAVLYIIWNFIRDKIVISGMLDFILVGGLLSCMYFFISFMTMSKEEKNMLLEKIQNFKKGKYGNEK